MEKPICARAADQRQVPDLTEQSRRVLMDACLTERDLSFMGARQRAMVLEVVNGATAKN